MSAFSCHVPRTLAASLLLQAEDGQQLRVELIPSAPSDPLLTDGAPAAPDALVLSAGAAARLGATAGTTLSGRLARLTQDGGRQAVVLKLRVQSVAPPHAFAREGAFVTLALADFVEDYQDGRVGPPPQDFPRGSAALPRAERASYAGFRLYARRLEQVPALDAALRAQGSMSFRAPGRSPACWRWTPIWDCCCGWSPASAGSATSSRSGRGCGRASNGGGLRSRSFGFLACAGVRWRCCQWCRP